MTDGRQRQLHPALLAALCLLPGLQTAVAVHFEIWPKVTYPLLKAVILLSPLVVWKLTRRRAEDVRGEIGLTRPKLWRGLLSGALFAAVILGGYYLFLAGRINPVPVIAKVQAMGLRRPEAYWPAAAFLCLGNSLVEEYYWRGFLLSQLRRWVPAPAELCLYGGLLFGVHHVFALGSSFAPSLVVLGVAGAVVAGGAWTLLRLRGWSLWDLWLSHVIADLAVFLIGWDLIRPQA